MIRKTALLYSLAGALMVAAPAMAQDQVQDAAPAEAEAQQPQSLTLTPGATVKSADGSVLGQLVGVQNGSNGQELTVRGSDGQVRPVALNGIRQDGADVVVAATQGDFQSAAPIGGAEPAPAADPAAQPADAAQPTPDAASDMADDAAEPTADPASDEPR